MPNEAIFALTICAISLLSYLIGNFNFAATYARIKGINIYESGSGNPGAMNMLRTFGTKMAFATLFVDALKGLIPTIAAYYIMQLVPCYGFGVGANAPAYLGYFVPNVGKSAMYIAGFSAVIGHCFPVFNKFKGGKGVSTAVGVFIAVNPIVGMLCFLFGLSHMFWGKYGFMSSFLSIIPNALIEMSLAIVYHDSIFVIIAPIVMAIIIVILHHENIVRAFKGTERRSNLLDRIKEHKAKKLEEQDTKINNEP